MNGAKSEQFLRKNKQGRHEKFVEVRRDKILRPLHGRRNTTGNKGIEDKRSAQPCDCKNHVTPVAVLRGSALLPGTATPRQV